MKKLLIFLMIIFSATLVHAGVSLDVKALMDIEVEEDGKKLTKRVQVEEAEPGKIVIYQITVVNQTDKAINDVVVDNPVPKNTDYIAASAYGEGSQIQFSIDSGKNYQNPSLLYYERILANGDRKKEVASPDQYTDIRWIVKDVAANSDKIVGFQVRVK